MKRLAHHAVWALGLDAATELMRAREIRHRPLVDAAGRLLARVPLPAAAVIMAGGMSTRLRPLTEETPKPLLRVGGRPLIEILMPTAVAESPGAATPP